MIYNSRDPNGYAIADAIMSSSRRHRDDDDYSYVKPVSAQQRINDAADSISSLSGIAQANSAFNADQAKLQRDWSEQQSAKAMAFNSLEAAKNRDWQMMMSNTAHQREIADLQAAGLNPVLSAMNGNGASVGSGATASGVVGSGSKADADTSTSAAVANLFGSVLSAQTALESANINARTQEAVADKYNAMSEIVANIGAVASLQSANIHAGASRYASDQSSGATRYAADIHAGASRYAAEQAAAADRYMADKTKYGMLDNVIGSIAKVLSGDSVSSARSASSGAKTAVKAVSNSVKSNPGYVSWNDSFLGKAVNKLFKKK